MRPTKTLIGAKAREAIIKGVRAVYIPVSKTFGPQGRNALLYRTFNRGSRITNDGYTVAECQIPKDPFVRLVAETFKEACKKTNEKAGDGTTGTAIVGGFLMEEVYKRQMDTESSYSFAKTGRIGVSTLRRNILESAKKVKEEIEKVAKKTTTLDELERIAVVSSEDEKIGKLVAEMSWEVGAEGFIDITEGYKGEIETEVIKGMRFPAKVPMKGFINNSAKFEMIARDCHVLVTNYSIDNVRQAINAFDAIFAKYPKIIVIAPSFSKENLEEFFKLQFGMTENGQKVRKPGSVEIYPVAVPSIREAQFEDIATYTGARFIDKSKGQKLEAVKETDLGFLEKLVVKDSEVSEEAIAVGGAGTKTELLNIEVKKKRMVKRGKEEIEVEDKVNEEKLTSRLVERVEELKRQIEETKEEPFKNLLRKRIAGLTSSVGIIRVGDTTSASSLYLKLKIEDAVFACKAALRGGYVKGGGLCLKEIAETLADDDILKPALLAPYNQIQASVDGGLEIQEDVIDPAEAIMYAVEHATSVVANLATVEIITPEDEDPVHGEGEFAIARALSELVISDKIHKGQLNESEREAERDNMNTLTSGLTIEEFTSQDNG